MAGGGSLERHHRHHEPEFLPLSHCGVGMGLQERLRHPLVLASLQLLKDICVHEVLRVLDDLHEQHVRIVRVLAEVDQQGLAPMGGCRLATGAVLGF